MRYIVMCEVSGGVTGFRRAPMKENDRVMYFKTREAAQTEANAAMAQANGNPYRRASFRYWVEMER